MSSPFLIAVANSLIVLSYSFLATASICLFKFRVSSGVADGCVHYQRRRTGSIRAAAGESVIDGAEDYFSVDRGIEPDHQYGI